MKNKIWPWLILVLVLALGIALGIQIGNRQSASQDKETGKEDGSIEIGISFDTFVLERWQRDRDLFVAQAQELGAQVNVQNANGDIKEQIDQIQYFIKKDVDVIVIIMVASDEESQALKSAIKKAQDAGIPVVGYDRLVPNADMDLYVSFDNEEVGRLMAQHMRDHIGNAGEILQINGPMADYNVPQLIKGFGEILDDTSLSITEADYADGWVAEQGLSYAEDYLQNHDTPAGIMCGNDGIAGYAIQALSERRLAGSVCVVGQDADLDACQRIVEGTQCMTVYKPVEQLAKRAAELAVDLAKGGSLDIKESIDDGTYEVPYEKLTPIAVTKENMDEVITGKYHEASDIYLNIRN